MCSVGDGVISIAAKAACTSRSSREMDRLSSNMVVVVLGIEVGVGEEGDGE